jgi:LmbE family N-acetylglucosaminyl deacetylase
MLDIAGVERALVVVAHPDDCDFGCAGTTALMTDAGVQVSYCIVTDGEAGGSDRTSTRADVARRRREEQTAAAAQVGVTDIAFLGHTDGSVTPSIELRRDITRVIRQRRPQRVLSQWPYRNFLRVFASHPDHMASGEATLCAVYPDARNPFAHMELLEQEHLEPHTVGEMWLMTGPGAQPQPDVIIDVTAVADRKLAALRCHASQYDDWEGLAERVRGMLRGIAVAGGLGEDRMAESFLLVTTG